MNFNSLRINLFKQIYHYLNTMVYVPEELIDEIEELKELWKYDEAIRLVNSILTRDPSNEDAILQIADIQYRKWEINKADKAVDFLNAQKNNNDPLGLYIKWLLEMEKNNWKAARDYLFKAMEMTNASNHEILRCYWLCEYRYWNREKGLNFLKDAFAIDDKDAEIVYNLIQLYILEQDYKKAQEMIWYFNKNKSWLKYIDKQADFYQKKISLFEKFIKAKKLFQIRK